MTGNISIEDKVCDIIRCYTPISAETMGSSLASTPYYLNARELVAVFLDLENEFSIDLNILFEEPIDFSINSIIRAIKIQLA